MDGRQLKRTLATHQRIADAFNDPRFPSRGPDTRMLVVTALWVARIERVPAGKQWDRVRDLLRLDLYGLQQMFRQDAPRWEPPPEDGIDYGGSTCEAPMIRRAGLCDHRPRSIAFRVTNPADGTWQMIGFCTRHRAYAAEVNRAERVRCQAGTLPVPAPNTGGLLPCYLGGSLESWAESYKHARSGWRPPAEGLLADDWPVTAKVVRAASAAPPKLELLAGEGEGATGTDGSPVLRIVRDS